MRSKLEFYSILVMCLGFIGAFDPISIRKCYCQTGFVWDKRKCIPGETLIPIVKFNPWGTSLINARSVSVSDISRVRCRHDQLLVPLKGGSFYIFGGGQLFHLFTSLNYKTTDYCIEHVFTKDKNIRLDALVCVSPPEVPRCCPKGTVFNNDLSCVSKNDAPFSPPITKEPSKLFWYSLEGPHIGLPHCYPDEILHQISLSSDTTLGSLLYRPNGIFLQVKKNPLPYLIGSSDYCVGIDQDKNGTYHHSATYCDIPTTFQGSPVKVRHDYAANVYIFPIFFYPKYIY